MHIMNTNSSNKPQTLFGDISAEASSNGIPNLIVGQMCILSAAAKTAKRPGSYEAVLNDMLKLNDLPAFKMGSVTPPSLTALLPKTLTKRAQDGNALGTGKFSSNHLKRKFVHSQTREGSSRRYSSNGGVNVSSGQSNAPSARSKQFPIKMIPRVGRVPRMYVCETCDWHSISASDVRRHISAVHRRLKPHRCLLCGRRFTQSFTLTRHIKECHDGQGRAHECHLCNKVYTSEAERDTHTEHAHRGEACHACHLCGQRFALKTSRNLHVELAHSGTRASYGCHVCGFQAGSQAAVTAHMEAAHAKWQHRCPYCLKNYRDSVALKAHVKYMHVRDGPRMRRFQRLMNLPMLKCPLCDRQFNMYSKLNRHIEHLHSWVFPIPTHINDADIKRIEDSEKYEKIERAIDAAIGEYCYIDESGLI